MKKELRSHKDDARRFKDIADSRDSEIRKLERQIHAMKDDKRKHQMRSHGTMKKNQDYVDEIEILVKKLDVANVQIEELESTVRGLEL